MSSSATVKRVGALALIGLFGLVGLGSGCLEYIHDPNAFYPEDFESSYAVVAPCAKSLDHNDRYSVVYANPTAQDTLDDGAASDFATGSVVVMAQFARSDCSDDYAWITAMRKDPPGSGMETDWKWQAIAATGRIHMEAYDVTSCVNCHGGTGGGKDFVKTAP